MGQVWLARHLKLETPVAVKVMSREAVASELLRTRFEREAKASAHIRCPNVVEVFDYGVDGEVPFIVMEMLEGEDLSAARTKRVWWSLREVSQIVTQAARGLQSAHAIGVVHRDIKPSNLFLADVGGGERVLKILDFGIAKTFDPDGPQVTHTNTQLGSPSYMSPEQVLAEPIDRRSDVWALGVVAFALLTGETPFRGDSPLAVAQKVVAGQRSRPSQLVEGLPIALDGFFDRALSVDPKGRFASAADLAEALALLARRHPDAIATGGVPEDETVPTIRTTQSTGG